jgi:hypothetical protein
MLNNDANTRALGTSAQLNLGALGQGGFGVGKSSVKPSKVSFADFLGPSTNTGRDGLAQPLETSYLLGL